MKKIIFLLILFSFKLNALTETEYKQSINFEIRNHDDYPITISLMDPVINKTFFQGITLSAKKGKIIPSIQKTVDIDQGFLRLIVQYKNPSTARQATKSYTFASSPNRTLYFAWEKKELRPQKGIFGKTQSGLSLKNNITVKDIITREHQEDKPDPYWKDIL